MDTIKKLYHYTSVETMRFILQDSNIYATNLKYMNDAEEYSNGLREMKKNLNDRFPGSEKLVNNDALKNMLDDHAGLYSISFTTQRDLLSQWSMYAKESGVSLGMDFRQDLEYCFYPRKPEKPEEKGKRSYIKKGLKPRKVFYLTENYMSDEEYKRISDSIEREIRRVTPAVTLEDIEDNAEMIWKQMIPYVKRYEFQAEEEYRLAFDVLDFPDALKVDYRNDKHVLKPYLDIACKGGWPIKEIIVGPGFNQNIVFFSLKHYLQNAVITVQQIKGLEFLQQCEAFFTVKGHLIPTAEQLLEDYKTNLLSDDLGKRYDAFTEIKDKILHNDVGVAASDKDLIEKRYLAENGIFLSMSEIPYIF